MVPECGTQVATWLTKQIHVLLNLETMHGIAYTPNLHGPWSQTSCVHDNRDTILAPPCIKASESESIHKDHVCCGRSTDNDV
jgi:hypothetical protein